MRFTARDCAGDGSCRERPAFEALCQCRLQQPLRILQLARAGLESGTFDHPRYEALARKWELWGAVALLLPLAAFTLMILKP